MVTVDSEHWPTSDCHGIASEYNLSAACFSETILLVNSYVLKKSRV